MPNTASIAAIETQILKIHKTINALLGEVISLTETVTALRNDAESAPRRSRHIAPASAPEVAPEPPAAVEIVPEVVPEVVPAAVEAVEAHTEPAPEVAPEPPAAVEIVPEVVPATPAAPVAPADHATRTRRTRDQIINDVVAGTGTFPTSWKGDVLAQAQAEVAALRAALPVPAGTFPPVSGLFQQVTPTSDAPDIQPIAETVAP